MERFEAEISNEGVTMEDQEIAPHMPDKSLGNDIPQAHDYGDQNLSTEEQISSQECTSIESSYVQEKNKRASPVSREHFELTDFQRDWDAHPEWHDLTITEVYSDIGRVGGARSFYAALCKYAKNVANGNEDEEKRIKEGFFRMKAVRREHYVLEDFQREWGAHPEWHRFSRYEVKSEEGKRVGVNAFYAALKKFAVREAGDDKRKRKAIIESVFVPRVKSRERFTLDDYIKEWKAHPEWHDMSPSQAQGEKGKANGASSFCSSIRAFAEKQFPDDVRNKKSFIASFFRPTKIFREHYMLDDFVREWEAHPEWKEFTITTLGNQEGIDSGANAFYCALLKFANMISGGDKQMRKGVIERFFPHVYEYRTGFSLNDYQQEWDAHPEWRSDKPGKEDIRKRALFERSLVGYLQREDEGNTAEILEGFTGLFDEQKIDRRRYALVDFEHEWASHPEWPYFAEEGVYSQQSIENGLTSYYRKLCSFAEEEYPDAKHKQRELVKRFFPSINMYRGDYDFDDFLREWNDHSEWWDASTAEAQKVESIDSGLNSFYHSLLYFSRSQSNDEGRKAIIERFFPARHAYRMHYTIEDYDQEWASHPDWHNIASEQREEHIKKNPALNSYYLSLLKFASKEAGGDERKRREIIGRYFPYRNVHREGYSLEDYRHEWNEHPMWKGVTSNAAMNGVEAESGLRGFYLSLFKFAKMASKGSEKERRRIMEEFFPFRSDRLYFSQGWVLQYALEVVLKLMGNDRMLVEKPLDIKERKGKLRPDLMRISEDGRRALLVDIKLQTTSWGITKDIQNYTGYVKEEYPDGGNLVFLCLNGPSYPKEDSSIAENIKIRYYHVLDFLERLADSDRNKSLIRLVRGGEGDSLGTMPPLSEEKLAKIREITRQLRILKKLVSERKQTRDMPLKEASKHMLIIQSRLKHLAKSKHESMDDILHTDFKSLMDF